MIDNGQTSIRTEQIMETFGQNVKETLIDQERDGERERDIWGERERDNG